jgi:predicted transcriptional regulator of viral defense system
MPPKAALRSRRELDRLLDAVASQAGYFTLAQGERAGLSGAFLKRQLDAHRVERREGGIFRLVSFPSSKNEGIVPLWLWSGQEGVFSHQTALYLHGLSGTRPAKQHLTVPESWSRRKLQVPSVGVLHYADIPYEEEVLVWPVPVTLPLRTVVDCALGGIPPRSLRLAIERGVRHHMFSQDEIDRALPRS